MANVRAGNTVYIDANGVISVDNAQKIAMIILTPTAANARIVIQDNASTPQNKADLRAPTSGASVTFSFVGAEISLTNGLRIASLTNGVATIILTSKGA